MKIKRFMAVLLVMGLLLMGIPVSANAAETKTVVGFELINADEIPPLIENVAATGYDYSMTTKYGAFGAACCAEFRVTYSDGTSEIARVGQQVGDDWISEKYNIDGPGGAEDTIVFYLGDFQVTHVVEYAETDVASIEIISRPVLTLGEDAGATKLGINHGLVLGSLNASSMDELVFRINYTDGTSETLRHDELDWPNYETSDQFYAFPKHDGYNVEIQGYIPGYNEEGQFVYWSGTYYDTEHVGLQLIMHYKGVVVIFGVEIQEGPVAKIITHPYDVEVNVDSYTRFEVGATGPNLTYQWQYRANENDTWKNYRHGETPSSALVFVAESHLDGTQYRCVVTDENGVTVYSEPATLTIFYPTKRINVDSEGYYYYDVEELVLGSDGVYRTPDGFAAYLAINNVDDGGLVYWLGGNTLYDYVSGYGEEYFSLTYWDDLLALMDEDGYVLLTERTLEYFLDLTTSNPSWGETDETYVYYYLAFDYDSTPTVHPDGWAQENGTWYYYQDGKPVTGWLKDGGYWYFMDSTGAMTTGWVQVNGNWYYMNKSGVMQTGWQKINGYWYYMSSGGVMQTGWVSIGGKWYYMNQNGVMQTGWVSVGGKWYYMASGGAMQTGWITVNGSRYYLDSKGVMQTGWQQLNGSWYYFSKGGVMQTGWVYDGGYWYYMNSAGVMQKGWVSAGGKWYYMNKSGVMQTGWVQDGGYWYYMDSKGVMVTGTQVIGGKTYIFNDHGVWIG